MYAGVPANVVVEDCNLKWNTYWVNSILSIEQLLFDDCNMMLTNPYCAYIIWLTDNDRKTVVAIVLHP